MGETQTKYNFTFIYPQGHTVMRKLDADGRVDTMQTLHNLNEGLFSVMLSWLPSVLFIFIKLMYMVFFLQTSLLALNETGKVTLKGIYLTGMMGPLTLEMQVNTGIHLISN